ncbi:fungal-specific transcription factor domain-domain-containing protein [Clohesyomyces aquaticus]|uniref:Fungal-specific transcription factor domain-domain-containing protein n=1 Tax=Clohesyomyces aquaticus TaxID=1231657 RepID=A0A1Y1YUN4_9PLEO|nr:fungal-specific transcription factor domain-domain-containing protein [Clohesyomyces aquaticus]
MEESAQTRPAAPRRVRVALACQRCKGRKQKCDGANPTCKSCMKAGITCVYEPTLRPRYPGGKMLYINALEERIAFLEGQLPEYGEDHFANVAHEDARYHHRQHHSSAASRVKEDVDEEDSTLVDGVAYLSLCASGTTDAAPEPFYMGSSSGATIARMIQSSIFRARRPHSSMRPLDTLRSGSMSSAASSSFAPSPVASYNTHPAPAQAQRLFSVFFNRLHTRWPILDRSVYESVFERQSAHGAMSVIERSTLHLIYAISARFLQLTKQSADVDPEAHFAAAIEPMDYILEQHNSATVQFLTLLAIYGQRSPYGAGVWSQVRFAITLCVELGMHRKPTPHSPLRNPRDLEIRRRIFWSCYCLDRLTSTLLGRTFAISDRDINVELPSDGPQLWDLTSTQQPSDDGKAWSNIMPFIHIVKLRQLQSKIQRTVFRVDVDPLSTSQSRSNDKVSRIRDLLDEWVNTIPEPPPHVEGGPSWMYAPAPGTHNTKPGIRTTYHDSRDFFTLQYHKTILSLYTTLLPSLDATDPRFLSIASSAASICSTYRALHQQRILSFTIIGLHSCFVAGLTLIYCLWRAPGLFAFKILEATRACSQCLTIFGEKWPSAVKYGEIFEVLSGGVLRVIMEPNVEDSGENSSRNRGRRIDLEVLNINMNQPTSSTTTAKNTDTGTRTTTATRPTDPLLGAVKNVFIEVDKDIPSSWQGWRVFNEMVQSDIQEPSLATGGISEAGGMPREQFQSPAVTGMWNDGMDFLGGGYDGMGGNMNGSGNGMGMDNGDTLMGSGFGTQTQTQTQTQTWDHGFFAGYE